MLLSRVLNIWILILSFDSFGLEALDRFAQDGEPFDATHGREPVERPVEPFRTSDFDIRILTMINALTYC